MRPTFRRWLVLAAALVAVVSGCGQGREATPQTSTTYELYAVTKPPPAELGPLPPDACFEATKGYGVALVAEARAPAGLCSELERYLPPKAGRAGWPVPETGDESQDTPTLECAVARRGVRVEALSWARGPGRVDPQDVCARMVEDGWDLQPQDEHGGADAPYGSCFVATARYEVAITGVTERGQALCDELGERHLPAVATRSMPAPDVDALGDPVCEATRGDDVVHVVSMPGDRGAVDLRAICKALALEGWTVSIWDR